MAEQHHKPKIVTPTTRCYTVGNVSDAKYQQVPAVTPKGRWLKEMGFNTGVPLEVKVLPDCLILTVKQLSPELEVIQTLRQLCPKLLEPKQRELWGCVEGLSVVPINRKKVAQWLKEFAGAMHSTCAEPKFKRSRGYFV